ncbi:MAG: TIGR00282 family metallophosphoesterase, partial [Nitrospirae bacterium]
MKILFIGDIIGEPGRKTVARQVPRLVRERGVACVIANAENAAGGFGVTPDVARELFAAGVHVLTSGNHIWDKKEIIDYIKDEPRLLRPANYPKGVPGLGRVVVTTTAGEKVGVVQVMGRVCMPTVDCPFRVVRHEVEAVKQEARTVIVDMHAEATSEKMAMGHFCDGRASLVVGTHTHVPTADHQILSGGTAYMSDAGMTGDYDSIIGMQKDEPLHRFTTGISSARFEPALGVATLSGVAVETDDATGLATRIAPVRRGGRLAPTVPD